MMRRCWKHRILAVVRVLEWLPEAADRFGSINDDMDILIAAIAMSHGAEVITASLVHFSRVNGLAVRHWMKIGVVDPVEPHQEAELLNRC